MSERIITFREAVEEAFIDAFARDEHLMLIGEDVRKDIRTPTLAPLAANYPRRVLSRIPLIEELLGGIGLGLSLGGMTPVVQINWSGFTPLLIDQIQRAAGWRFRMVGQKDPHVIFRIGHDGYDRFGVGPELATPMLATLLHTPNLVLLTPSSPYHAKGLLNSAFQESRTIVFFEHKRLYEMEGNVPREPYSIPFGASSVVREGSHLTLVTWLYTTHFALEAAKQLETEGVSVEIVVLHSLHPMDMDAIFASVRKTGKLVILEEEMVRGGVGAEIAARVTETMSARVSRIGSRNVPIPGRGRYSAFVTPTLDMVLEGCRRAAL